MMTDDEASAAANISALFALLVHFAPSEYACKQMGMNVNKACQMGMSDVNCNSMECEVEVNSSACCLSEVLCMKLCIVSLIV